MQYGYMHNHSMGAVGRDLANFGEVEMHSSEVKILQGPDPNPSHPQNVIDCFLPKLLSPKFHEISSGRQMK